MTDDVQELVERLLRLGRLLAGLYQGRQSPHAIEPEDAVACCEAADALTRLAAERDKCDPWLKPGETPAERIKREFNDLQAALNREARAKMRAERAEASVARLRDALEAIHDMCASAQPTTADRYIDRIDERAATVLGDAPAREAAK
jgi:hypothetical protein